MGIGTVHAQFDVPPGLHVSVENWERIPEDDEDADGVFLSFGGVLGNGELVVCIPDETADRLLLALVRDAPRISSRTLALLQSALAERVEARADEQRHRLDPGPLPVGAEPVA